MKPVDKPEKAVKKRFRRHIAKKVVIYTTLLLLLIHLAVLGGVIWITQTGSGQAWVVKTANSLLARGPDAQGLSFRLTSLSGSIPFNFEFGLESEDRQGIWLVAPQNRFVWSWKELPQTIHIPELRLNNIDMTRLPDLPPKTEPVTPARPLSLADIREYIRQAGDFLSKKHWWLPRIMVDEISANAVLPPDLPLENQRIVADAAAALAFEDNRANARARLSARNSAGGKITTPALEANSLGLNLAATAGPIPDGLSVTFDLDGAASDLTIIAKDIPADFLGENVNFAVNAKAEATNSGVGINLSGPGLSAGHISLITAGSWHSDEGWKEGKLSGPLAFNMKLSMEPLASPSDSRLKAVKAPLELAFGVAGDLDSPDVNLTLGCAEIAEAGHEITNTRVDLQGERVALPINTTLKDVLNRENHLNFRISTEVDKQPAEVSTLLFVQNLSSGKKGDAWRVGLRNLRIDALGLSGTGNLGALIGMTPYPAVDGSLNFSIRDWNSIEKLMPASRLSGSANLSLAFTSGIAGQYANPLEAIAAVPEDIGEPRQDATLKLDAPKFSLRSGNGDPVALANVKAAIALGDIFQKGSLDAQIEAGSIDAAKMRMSANITAQGPFTGPLKATVVSNGSVKSRIAATWQTGRLDLHTLDVSADLGAFIGDRSAKKLAAGIRAASPAQFFYGEDGYRIQGLDLKLLPGGRLTANGGLSPQKIDLNLNLSDFDFKYFKKIVPDLPSGSVAATVSLKGTPARPVGNFRLAVNNVSMPNFPLAPASLALVGELVNRPGGGALKTRLELNPATVRALGGTAAEINATVPLQFGKDGIPAPDMKGPLQARIQWDGSLGPIWTLLPIADRRLNGRINIDATAGGTLAKPAIRGSATIGHARYEDLELGILLTDINLKLDLMDSGRQGKPQKGALDSLPGAFKLAFSLSDGRGGTVTANGTGGLDGENLALKAKIADLKPLRRRDVQIELSGNLAVAGSALAPLVDGEIIVDKGEVLLNNLAMTGSVTTLDITTPAELKAAQKKPAQPASGMGGKLNVRVRMLPRFSVEGRGLASLWQCNLLISGPLSNPQVTGSINSVRGNFDFLGKVFALTRGRVFFGGGALTNPLVDIELTYETPDLTAHIMVSGPVNKIRLTMTSDPTMPRDEILSRVLFGRSVNDLSRMEALQLAGAVAQLAGFGGGSGPLGSVKKALGVDVLRIGTANTGTQNQSNDETGGGTTLEMGKYINDYIYMGVQQGFKADSTAFIIEIELSPHSSLEVRTEQNNTWGGIKWRKNY